MSKKRKSKKAKLPECSHRWVSNSGDGGIPRWRMNVQLSDEPLMHTRCSICNARTWHTKEQWEGLPESRATEDRPGDGT